ncbi:MAG: SlyX family protein [Rhodocyclaceae bacterium]|nr:SlyX family protein [Rhodocyclaceae bacterium]MCB1901412.1 SlyX family protein [Rhodocyclaceae bacterium]MCP5311226.1 SlyX family protein [Zoogloeaceae bacterium]
MSLRIEALEAKLVFAEDLLETLNLTVYRQQQHIERLQKQLARLAEQVAGNTGAGEARNLKDEIPPHY